MVEHGHHPALDVTRPNGADAEVREYPWVVRFRQNPADETVSRLPPRP
jgi:hypothetical protein